MRSVTVVLPASMWAMIPMLRTRSNGSCRTDSRASFGATATAIPYLLPAVMAEGLVGLRHLVGLFFAPHRAAGVVHRVGDELLHRDAVVARVRELLADGRTRSAWHQDAPGFCFSGAFAPYFERPCLRSRTPAASSVPRTMWYFTEGRSFTRPPRTS